MFHDRLLKNSLDTRCFQGSAGTDARLPEKAHDMKKTKFDRYLAGPMERPAFVARFRPEGRRHRAGCSQLQAFGCEIGLDGAGDYMAIAELLHGIRQRDQQWNRIRLEALAEA